jgi:2-aminobenzoate-CoA ligase
MAVDRFLGLDRRGRDFVKGLLAPYKCPRTIRFLDELPKTATGKLKRYELRKAAAASS